MQKIRLIGLMVLVLGLSYHLAFAYTANGFVNDWGIDLSAATSRGYLDTHLPSGGKDIDKVTEDNADTSMNPARTDNWWKVWPGWSPGNSCDAEAMYFDNDYNYAYIAIISGIAPINSYQPGDIGISIDGDNTYYEYGLRISDAHLYSSITGWDDVSLFTESNPWIIDRDINGNVLGTDKGAVDFAYIENLNNHYVIEAKIPLSYLGLNGYTERFIDLHWTMSCGNDNLNLHADINPIPEPATLTLLGLGLLGLLGLRKKVL